MQSLRQLLQSAAAHIGVSDSEANGHTIVPICHLANIWEAQVISFGHACGVQHAPHRGVAEAHAACMVILHMIEDQ